MCGWVILAGAVFLAGCTTDPYGPPAPPASAQLGSNKANVSIDAAPDDALISVNGAIKGTTPLTIQIEIDNLGEVAMDYDIVATFTNSSNGARSTTAEPVSYRLARGDRVPSTIDFGPDDASAR
jgi:hypothetical protein